LTPEYFDPASGTVPGPRQGFIPSAVALCEQPGKPRAAEPAFSALAKAAPAPRCCPSYSRDETRTGGNFPAL